LSPAADAPDSGVPAGRGGDAFEYPDEAGYPDGKGFLSETESGVVADVGDEIPDPPGIDLYVVDDESEKRYEAVSGDTLLGSLTYTAHGDVVGLLTTEVFPEFRHQGVASALIRQVLDRLRSEGRLVDVRCAAVDAFIERHPEYRDLVVPAP
jgi:predicted GNAT family acetyltransferase